MIKGGDPVEDQMSLRTILYVSQRIMTDFYLKIVMYDKAPLV